MYFNLLRNWQRRIHLHRENNRRMSHTLEGFNNSQSILLHSSRIPKFIAGYTNTHTLSFQRKHQIQVESKEYIGPYEGVNSTSSLVCQAQDKSAPPPLPSRFLILVPEWE